MSLFNLVETGDKYWQIIQTNLRKNWRIPPSGVSKAHFCETNDVGCITILIFLWDRGLKCNGAPPKRSYGHCQTGITTSIHSISICVSVEGPTGQQARFYLYLEGPSKVEVPATPPSTPSFKDCWDRQFVWTQLSSSIRGQNVINDEGWSKHPWGLLRRQWWCWKNVLKTLLRMAYH